uniref:Uncharacterized protein n=1 Tax=Rhizophora mucronata TaxID=61149 RepID=A0A2P2MZD7_RHIMU
MTHSLQQFPHLAHRLTMRTKALIAK